ncbi:hypothetical protein FQN57_005730 [Myotisia sp. PD_48]|nr:hypothetical protein FQN57_005730 [Myotisia sp. PD_48]
MSQDTPNTLESSNERISHLEAQVKGLMETVNEIYKLFHLHVHSIPKPAQYITPGGLRADTILDEAVHEFPLVSESQVETETLISAVDVSNVDVSSLPSYEYSPLDTESSEIRLLALKTNTSPSDPVVCRLITANLDDAPDFSYQNESPIHRFTPLSYCWGTASMTEQIIIDGHRFSVTPSLYGALLHFRKISSNLEEDSFLSQESDETYWWIDAICVNQNDLSERSSQVGLMTQLYQQGQVTHVWLGEESGDSARAMQIIRELGYLPTSLEEINSWEYIRKPGQTHRPDGPGRPMVKLPTEEPPISAKEKHANYNALINLYQRPWFSRVWIRQEVALPKGVKFHCGTDTCTWEEVMRTADILTYLVDEYHFPSLQQDGIRRNDSFVSCFRQALDLLDIREQINRHGSNEYAPLQSLALGFRQCQATDPRDKVYAALPLTDPDHTEIRADYRKDKHEMYKEVTLSLMADNLDFLSGCQNPSRIGGLPSWVPDLEEQWNPLPTPTDLGYDKSPYNTWGNEPEDNPQFTYVAEDSKLNVRGIIFDAIRAIDDQAILTANASNQDVRTITARWKDFYSSQRAELFGDRRWNRAYEGESRYTQDECDNMFDVLLVKETWSDRVLQNIDGDQYRQADEPTRFQRWDKNIDHDPTLKRVKRLLLSDDTVFSKTIGKNHEYFANLRSLAVGRRLMVTSRGGLGLVPSEATPGDKVCFFDGCKCPFIIRDSGQNTNVIVGQACTSMFNDPLTSEVDYFGNITLHQSSKKLKKSIISIV